MLVLDILVVQESFCCEHFPIDSAKPTMLTNMSQVYDTITSI